MKGLTQQPTDQTVDEVLSYMHLSIFASGYAGNLTANISNALGIIVLTEHRKLQPES